MAVLNNALKVLWNQSVPEFLKRKEIPQNWTFGNVQNIHFAGNSYKLKFFLKRFYTRKKYSVFLNCPRNVRKEVQNCLVCTPSSTLEKAQMFWRFLVSPTSANRRKTNNHRTHSSVPHLPISEIFPVPFSPVLGHRNLKFKSKCQCRISVTKFDSKRLPLEGSGGSEISWNVVSFCGLKQHCWIHFW